MLCALFLKFALICTLLRGSNFFLAVIIYHITTFLATFIKLFYKNLPKKVHFLLKMTFYYHFLFICALIFDSTVLFSNFRLLQHHLDEFWCDQLFDSLHDLYQELIEYLLVQAFRHLF